MSKVVTVSYFVYYDTLFKNATEIIYKLQQLFYYKMRQKFFIKCVRFSSTKCDSYYKMPRLLQNKSVHGPLIHKYE